MSFLGPPKRILVIDDEEGIVEYISIILRTRGYVSIPAYDGEQGLALLQSEQPDLVISDLRMPRMSGLELARRRKELPPDLASIPFLVISSMGNEQQKPDEFWCQGLGCDDFLAKPFEPLTLLARVEALLRRERYRKSETPEPATRRSVPTPTGGLKDSRPRPAPRQFTVKTGPLPVDVVRKYVEGGWRDDNLVVPGGRSRAAGLAAPSGAGVLLDVSIIHQGAEEAEVAVLREEQNPADGQPIAYDERYHLVCPEGEWLIERIAQNPLVPEP